MNANHKLIERIFAKYAGLLLMVMRKVAVGGMCANECFVYMQ